MLGWRPIVLKNSLASTLACLDLPEQLVLHDLLCAQGVEAANHMAHALAETNSLVGERDEVAALITFGEFKLEERWGDGPGTLYQPLG